MQIQPVVSRVRRCLRSNPNSDPSLCGNLGKLLKSLYFCSLICKMVIRTYLRSPLRNEVNT